MDVEDDVLPGVLMRRHRRLGSDERELAVLELLESTSFWPHTLKMEFEDSAMDFHH